MKKAETLLNDKKTYTPRQFRAGVFKKEGKVKIDCTFIPLICTELYKKWRQFHIDLFTASKDYLEKQKVALKVKNEESVKEFEEATEKLQTMSDEASECAYKLMGIIIKTNDNPPDWETKEWIMTNFVAEDLSEFIEVAMNVVATKKK